MFETDEEIKSLIEEVTKSQKPRRHRYYLETVNHAERMGVHVEGHTPYRILEEKRPNEPEDIKTYRLLVWKNITESLAGKVLHTIAKIFDPKLFNVKYPETPQIIPEEESLENYLNNNFGIYKSIWVFIRETLLTKELSDPNSLCVVMPQNFDIDETEFLEPIPLIFKAKYLVDFVEGEYYVLWIPKHHYIKGYQHTKEGELWILTKEFIKIFKISGEKKTELKLEIETGFLPAFRLGGVVKGDRLPYWYKSFIYGVQPHWDKVVSMVSDLDGSIVNHLFPTPWEWTVECDPCGGTGEVETNLTNGPVNGAKTNVVCRKCQGTGRVPSKGPFGAYSIKRDAINPELPNPVPPAGFITKDIEPIRELKTLKDEEIWKGFEAINMEVIHRSGENQSGVAKTIDRADLDSMLMRIGQHVFDCNVEPIIWYTAIWRYGSILSEDELKEYVNGITVSKPKDFSVLGVNMLMEELKAAAGSNVSSNYLRSLESEIVTTRFSNNPQEQKKQLATIQLKPFPNMTSDEISLGVANKTIQIRDAIRNSNIDELVTKAIEENEDFLDLGFSEKLSVINKIIDGEYIDDPLDTLSVELDG